MLKNSLLPPSERSERMQKQPISHVCNEGDKLLDMSCYHIYTFWNFQTTVGFFVGKGYFLMHPRAGLLLRRQLGLRLLYTLQSMLFFLAAITSRAAKPLRAITEVSWPTQMYFTKPGLLSWRNTKVKGPAKICKPNFPLLVTTPRKVKFYDLYKFAHLCISLSLEIFTVYTGISHILLCSILEGLWIKKPQI